MESQPSMKWQYKMLMEKKEISTSLQLIREKAQKGVELDVQLCLLPKLNIANTDNLKKLVKKH